MHAIYLILVALGNGVVDSVAFWRSRSIIVNSLIVQDVLQKCLLLNGVLLGGSLLLYQALVKPLVKWLLLADDIYVLDWIYELFWCWPIYLLALLFNAFWYQDMFTHLNSVLMSDVLFIVNQHQEELSLLNPGQLEQVHLALNGLNGVNRSNTITKRTVIPVAKRSGFEEFWITIERVKMAGAEEVVRILMIALCTVLASFISWAIQHVLQHVQEYWVKMVSQLFYYSCIAAVHSFHAFDYRWGILPIRPSAKRIPDLRDKIRFLDQHLIYFVAYGALMSAILSLPRFIAATLYAIVFPMMVLQTLSSRPHAFPVPHFLHYFNIFQFLFISVNFIIMIPLICYKYITRLL